MYHRAIAVLETSSKNSAKKIENPFVLGHVKCHSGLAKLITYLADGENWSESSPYLLSILHFSLCFPPFPIFQKFGAHFLLHSHYLIAECVGGAEYMMVD